MIRNTQINKIKWNMKVVLKEKIVMNVEIQHNLKKDNKMNMEQIKKDNKFSQDIKMKEKMMNKDNKWQVMDNKNQIKTSISALSI